MKLRVNRAKKLLALGFVLLAVSAATVLLLVNSSGLPSPELNKKSGTTSPPDETVQELSGSSARASRPIRIIKATLEANKLPTLASCIKLTREATLSGDEKQALVYAGWVVEYGQSAYQQVIADYRARTFGLAEPTHLSWHLWSAMQARILSKIDNRRALEDSIAIMLKYWSPDGWQARAKRIAEQLKDVPLEEREAAQSGAFRADGEPLRLFQIALLDFASKDDVTEAEGLSPESFHTLRDALDQFAAREAAAFEYAWVQDVYIALEYNGFHQHWRMHALSLIANPRTPRWLVDYLNHLFELVRDDSKGTEAPNDIIVDVESLLQIAAEGRKKAFWAGAKKLLMEGNIGFRELERVQSASLESFGSQNTHNDFQSLFTSFFQQTARYRLALVFREAVEETISRYHEGRPWLSQLLICSHLCVPASMLGVPKGQSFSRWLGSDLLSAAQIEDLVTIIDESIEKNISSEKGTRWDPNLALRLRVSLPGQFTPSMQGFVKHFKANKDKATRFSNLGWMMQYLVGILEEPVQRETWEMIVSTFEETLADWRDYTFDKKGKLEPGVDFGLCLSLEKINDIRERSNVSKTSPTLVGLVKDLREGILIAHGSEINNRRLSAAMVAVDELCNSD